MISFYSQTHPSKISYLFSLLKQNRITFYFWRFLTCAAVVIHFEGLCPTCCIPLELCVMFLFWTSFVFNPSFAVEEFWQFISKNEIISIGRVLSAGATFIMLWEPSISTFFRFESQHLSGLYAPMVRYNYLSNCSCFSRIMDVIFNTATLQSSSLQ